MEFAKHDLSLTHDGRTFRIRAYLDNYDPLHSGWHTIIVENRTPISHDLPVTSGLDICLKAAVHFVEQVLLDSAARGEVVGERAHINDWESEGGASASDDSSPPL